MTSSEKLIIYARCIGYKKRAAYWSDINFDKFRHFWAKHQAMYHLIIDLGLLDEYKKVEDI